MIDEILSEIWKAKDDISRECGYDPARLAAKLKRQQKQSGPNVRIDELTNQINRSTILP
jgi:hypothetical protein